MGERGKLSGRLVVVCGLPGAGKTRHAVRLETTLPAVRLCPDDWMDHLGIDLWDHQARGRVESLQWALAERLLQMRQSVVIEWGTWSREERDELRDGAREVGATAELHYLHAPLEVLRTRVEERGRDDPPIAGQQLLAWAQKFEPPDDEEGRLWDRFVTLGP